MARERTANWDKLYTELLESQVSMADFCRQKKLDYGVAKSAFNRVKKKLFGGSVKPKKSSNATTKKSKGSNATTPQSPLNKGSKKKSSNATADEDSLVNENNFKENRQYIETNRRSFNPPPIPVDPSQVADTERKISELRWVESELSKYVKHRPSDIISIKGGQPKFKENITDEKLDYLNKISYKFTEQTGSMETGFETKTEQFSVEFPNRFSMLMQYHNLLSKGSVDNSVLSGNSTIRTLWQSYLAREVSAVYFATFLSMHAYSVPEIISKQAEIELKAMADRMVNQNRGFNVGETPKEIINNLIKLASEDGDKGTIVKLLPVLKTMHSETTDFDFSIFSKMAEMVKEEDGWDDT